ncbi:TetR/AcrR family transcriptional regulator [Nonomuraea salmonea]|uniref:TetR/AcrR family transcriptional regulator n=1 Tax=Nonomuraea salmonea TaxID=46181 RepID=UPI00360D17B3
MGRKGAETRGRLLDTTQELIEAGGYFGAGLNQVIAASGMPRGSLYFHFPGARTSWSPRRCGGPGERSPPPWTGSPPRRPTRRPCSPA